MAVALRAGNTITTGTTSLTVTGVSMETDDLLVLAAFHKNTANVPNMSDTTGWERISNWPSTSGNMAVFLKKATSTGTHANVSFSGLTSPGLGAMAAFSGVDVSGTLSTTALLDHDGGGNTWIKQDADNEGSYILTWTDGANWTVTEGSCAICIMALDNDGTYIDNWQIFDDGGNNVQGAGGINQISTTSGSDGTLGWGFHVVTAGQTGGTWSGFAQDVVEGSAGTASNTSLMMILNPAAAATPKSYPPRRIHRGDPVMGLLPRPRRRRAGA